MGEARNPGPPRILCRPAVHSIRFEILSSDHEQMEVPSTVPASEGAVRVARRRSLVILSDSIPVAHRVPPSTIPDAGSEGARHHMTSEIESDPAPLDVNPNRVLREAMSSLDEVDGMVLLRRRAVVMRSPPRFMRGAYKSVLRFTLQASAAKATGDEQQHCRAWKLFLLAPRILLFRRAPEEGSQRTS